MGAGTFSECMNNATTNPPLIFLSPPGIDGNANWPKPVDFRG